MAWVHDITDCLARLKASGNYRLDSHGYTQAWNEAMRCYRPTLRDQGEREPRLFDTKAGDQDPGVVEFTRMVCELAWLGEVGEPGSGNGPALRHWRHEFVRLEDQEPIVGLTRQAA